LFIITLIYITKLFLYLFAIKNQIELNLQDELYKIKYDTGKFEESFNYFNNDKILLKLE